MTDSMQEETIENPLHVSVEALLECSMRTKQLLATQARELRKKVEHIAIERENTLKQMHKVEIDSIASMDLERFAVWSKERISNRQAELSALTESL